MKKINYRKLYESHYNILIPKSYELHHIDADRTNNNISNLIDLPKEFHKALHSWVGLIPRIYICHLLEWYLSQDKSFSAKALGYYLQVKFKKINTSKTLELECKKYLRNQKWNQGMSAYTNGYQAV